MKTTWITLALFDDAQAGQIVEQELESAGFDARLFNDRFLQGVLFLCPPQAVWRVQVREAHLKQAEDHLNTHPSAALKGALHCPECGSLKISYPQMTRKFLLPTLLLHLGIIFRIIRHQAYCESCHYVWTLPKKGMVLPKPAHVLNE